MHPCRKLTAVFDIGANIGAHTLGLARSVGPTGRVFAFEPADFAFAKLKRNLALNPELNTRTHTHPIPLAAAPTAPRQPEIYASWPFNTDGFVRPKHPRRLLTTLHAAVDTFVSFVERKGIDRLDLIKIDVDGHEYPELKAGLRKLSAHFRNWKITKSLPTILQEIAESWMARLALHRRP